MTLQFYGLFLTLCTLCSAQQIKYFNTFKGGNVRNKIDATPPYSLYVSAQSDDNDVLKKVLITTEDNQYASLYVLKMKKLMQGSGLLQPFVINSTAYLSTDLSDLNTLHGFMYITTEKQLYDKSFLVIDVDQSQKISINRNFQPDSTIVFLNTVRSTTPIQSSMFSGWLQSSDSSVSIYRGYPSDDKELIDTQIFSNPVRTDLFKTQFIPNVEKFSLTLGIFYLKIHNDVSFLIEPSYFELDGMSTSAYSTTGFYMKAINQIEKNITITCLRDTSYNGTTCGNWIGLLPESTGNVAFQEVDSTQTFTCTITPNDQIFPCKVGTIGQKIFISSIGANGGEYFVQYYIYQDQRVYELDSTTASSLPTVPVTTRGIRTTTKKFSAVTDFFVTVFMVVFLLL
uniref:CUB-like domain-containing protein n=1 Tax=Caenorhabditis japonica TaxID=281687 RepID=A0A8R1E267_CAEJA